MTKARRSDHSGPIHESAPARAPPSVMPIIPTMLIREFARTSDIEGGRRRGAAAARATAYDREATSAPRAAGKSQALSSTSAPASTQARKARTATVVPMAQRRPWRKRSRIGPMSGARTTKGAIVSSRKRATWPRASSTGIAKTVPASETVSAASPAIVTPCSSTKRANPEESAPSARAKRWKRALVARLPLATP
jgi:hypothetical protein